MSTTATRLLTLILLLQRRPNQKAAELAAALNVSVRTIQRYIDAKPRNKFGKHEYRAEDCGLTDGQIRDRFRFYTDHYGIALED